MRAVAGSSRVVGIAQATRRPALRAASLAALAASLIALSAPPAAADVPELSSPYIIDVWETEAGLPENSATAMVQTPDGFLWFGTFNGLVRFDGARFSVLDTSNAPDLPSAAIVNLYLDSRQRLWISTDRGLALVIDGRWTRLGPEAGWVGNYVRTFAEGEDGEMFVMTFDRHLLRVADGRAVEIPTPVDGDPLRRGGYPYVDPAGTLWLLHPDFVGSWNGDGWQRRDRAFGAPAGDYVGAGPARDGGLWVLRAERLTKYLDGQPVAQVPVTTPVQAFWSLHEDSTGTVWVTSFQAGLYRYSPHSGWLHLTTANGLSYNGVRFAFEDRERNIWVGTSGGGLLRFKRRTFATWGLREGLPERVVKSVAEIAGGRIAIGTHGAGVVTLDGTRVFGEAGVPAFVQSMLVDRGGQLWVGLYDRGLYRVGAADDHAEFLFPDSSGAWSVYALYEDSQGRVWAGGDRGVSVFDAQGRKSFPLADGTSVRAILEDPATGSMWIGTASAGLLKLIDGTFERVAAAAPLATSGISALHRRADGTLLIGTFDRGLAALSGERLVSIGQEQGLAPRGIGYIVDDRRGSVWLGTNRGVLRVDERQLADLVAGSRHSLDPRLYDRSDGLISAECPVGYQPTAIRDSAGRLWFATLKGVARVDPASVTVNTVPPVVRIDQVQLDDRLVADAMRQPFSSRVGPVTIPPGGRRVEVRYTALSYGSPEKLRFQHRVDGLDADWIDGSGERVAYLRNLGPGSYVFRVRAANADGIWSTSHATVALTVQPFLWQTTWFAVVAIGALTAAVALLAWQGSRFALRRQIEREAQERALAQERARLASVLDATSDCVAFADPEGRLLYLNPAGRRIAGFGTDTPLSPRTLADLHPPAAVRRLVRDAIPAAARDGLWSGETTLAAPDGREIPVSQVIAAHRSGSGQVEFLSTIVRDISDRVRAQEQLQASEERLRQSQKMEAVGRLAGGIAHDFNNLLTVIAGYTSLLLERHPPGDPDYTAIDETQKASARAADLTRQLLAFGRKQVLTMSVVDVNAAVRGVERMLRPLIGEHIEFVTDLAADPGAVRADRSQLDQVIVNLAVNARDAMPAGGRLTIATANVTVADTKAAASEVAPGEYVRLTVTDTGVGMEPAVRDHVFEPFYTTKEDVGGSGLGLSTVYGIVRQSGGHIEVDSAPECGSTFTVYLPREPGPPPAPEPVPKPETAARGREVVLVVEDEGSVRSIVRTTLERAGYTVLDAEGAGEALRLASEHAGRIDLLLTDVVMPGTNGRELADLVLRRRPQTRVLFVSGYTDDAVLRHDVLDAGVEFLQKPFTPAALARKVRDVLDGAAGRSAS